MKTSTIDSGGARVTTGEAVYDLGDVGEVLASGSSRGVYGEIMQP